MILPLEERLKLQRKFTDAELKKYHALGWSDKRCAKKFKCCQASVRMRRMKLCLQSNYGGRTSKADMKATYKKHSIKPYTTERKTKLKKYHHKYHESKHGNLMNSIRKKRWRQFRRSQGLPYT